MPMRLTAIILLLFATHLLSAQRWVDLMLDPGTDLHTVKQAFDAEWEGVPYRKGKGWKQFHRWYWFMDQRTWPDGQRLDPAVYMEGAVEMKAARERIVGQRDVSLWEPLGPTFWNSISYNPGNGRVNMVALDPTNAQTIYAGTPASGLWKSTNGGNGWTPLFTDLPSMGVSGIAVHPTASDTVYIATGDGDGADTYSAGVLKSYDGGLTWNPTGLDWTIGQARNTRALRMHPYDPRRLVCATTNGLYRTVNGGDTWAQALPGSFFDVEFRPGDSLITYACTDRFYRSGTNGISFSAISNGLPGSSEVGRMAIAVSPADPLLVYVLCSNEEDDSFLGLYRSEDGGASFQLMSSSPNLFGYEEDGTDSGGQAWYDMALVVDPNDPNTLYAGGVNVWKSTDGGSTWTIKAHWISPSEIGYTHADIHGLEIIDGRLFCASDGGLYVSADDGEEWTDLSAGLDITQFYRLGGSELESDLIMAGAQDNGSNRFVDGQWTHVFGADGMEAAVDPTDPFTVYASYQLGGIMRSVDRGVNWDFIGENVADDGPWVTPFAIDPYNPYRIAAGYTNVWISDDQGDSWNMASNWSNEEQVSCLAIAPSDGNVIYVGRSDLLMRSTLGGAAWESIQGPELPQRRPTSFAVDPENPQHVWVSFSGTTAGQKVYESLDGGDTWTDRSAGLPNVPVNSVVLAPGTVDGVYAGTDLGVFYRDDLLNTWEPFGEGMPNVVVTELEVNQASGKLRAATYGRGIWQADLYEPVIAGLSPRSNPGAPRMERVDEHGRYRIALGPEYGNLLSISLTDPSGRLLLAPSLQPGSLIDLSGRASGAYLATITSTTGTWTYRISR
jgi:photosystem II stability/assembly factor-like uncharacterized protein